jgi:hypothetical protein
MTYGINTAYENGYNDAQRYWLRQYEELQSKYKELRKADGRDISDLTADELLTLSKMRRADIPFDSALRYVLSERS